MTAFVLQGHIFVVFVSFITHQNVAMMTYGLKNSSLHNNERSRLSLTGQFQRVLHGCVLRLLQRAEVRRCSEERECLSYINIYIYIRGVTGHKIHGSIRF